jgi:uncharacterized protein
MDYQAMKLSASADPSQQSAAAQVRAQLEKFIMGEGFSCVGGKTACARGTLVHRHYAVLGGQRESARLHGELADFAARRDSIHETLATFIATFDGPRDLTEERFEQLLWRQLQLVHDVDRKTFRWAPGVASDPASRHFAYSVAGQPFFVVGLHGNSSRHTRRFGWPALVFNSHIQFARLKQGARYERIQREVRRRELALQGSLNPSLAEFGERPESQQYSGRAVPQDWACPFQPGEWQGGELT